MSAVKTGDRVKMDTTQTSWLSKAPLPDLGLGTVVATTQAEDDFLMEGWYVGVEWDDTGRYDRVNPDVLVVVPS